MSRPGSGGAGAALASGAVLALALAGCGAPSDDPLTDAEPHFTVDELQEMMPEDLPGGLEREEISGGSSETEESTLGEWAEGAQDAHGRDGIAAALDEHSRLDDPDEAGMEACEEVGDARQQAVTALAEDLGEDTEYAVAMNLEQYSGAGVVLMAEAVSFSVPPSDELLQARRDFYEHCEPLVVQADDSSTPGAATLDPVQVGELEGHALRDEAGELIHLALVRDLGQHQVLYRGAVEADGEESELHDAVLALDEILTPELSRDGSD